MISLVIPAHNEAAVIQRCLAALLDGAAPGDLDILVIANGCADNTAALAAAFGPPVRVIQTGVASKIHALNLGDAAATAFPRFYIDADVVLPLPALRQLARHLDDPAILAVAPLPRFDTAHSSWPVRAYYDIHQRLPAFREGIGGSGVYGLSKAGRSRFDQFPNVTADDGFIRLQFRPDERRTCPDCRSTVRAPGTLRELVAIKTRSHVGTRQLRRLYPGLFAGNIGQSNGGQLKRLLLYPWFWPSLAAYGYVKVAARIRGKRQLAAGAPPAWERDETSRATTDYGAANLPPTVARAPRP